MSAASGETRKAKAGQGDSPADRLKAEAIGLVGALGDRAMGSVLGRLQDTAGRLTEYVENGAGPGLMAAVTGGDDNAGGNGPGAAGPVRKLLGRGQGDGAGSDGGGGDGDEGKRGQSGGKGRNLKVTNIVETIDVGAPVRLTYDLWTQFADFPSFMKKVESVEQQDEEQTLSWKAQVFWSHRTWESTILEQVPEDKIIWRSKGAKGYVDGAVTFHELAPNLTRILMVLEYHPQGFFEHTGNIWRAQGRRARLELKHFRRHLMSEVLLHPDEVEGWRGVIRDGEIVSEDEEAEQDEYQDDEQDESRDDEPSDATRDEPDEEEDREDGGEDEEAGEPRGQRGADRQERRRPARGERQADRRPPSGSQGRSGRGRDRPGHEERPRRETRRAESRGGARS